MRNVTINDNIPPIIGIIPISPNKKIAVIHNGIIENFKNLQEELEKKGHTFTSQTDTEVIAHLLEEHYKGNLKEAVFATLKRIQGA